VKPSYTLVRKKVVGRFKKLMSVEWAQKEDFLKKSSFCAQVNSYFGHFIHANSFNLRKSIWEKKLKGKAIFTVGERFEKILLKK